MKYYNLSEFDGVEILHNESISDDIGVSEIYNLSDWVKGDTQHLKSRFFCAKNFKKGTIRGLHGQVRSDDEHKFIKCISGSIFEVLIDCRRKSPSLVKLALNFLLLIPNRLFTFLRDFCMAIKLWKTILLYFTI